MRSLASPKEKPPKRSLLVEKDEGLTLYSLSEGGSKSGKNGGAQHRAIVDAIRFQAVPILRKQYPNTWCTGHYTLMAAMCGSLGRKAYPDMVVGPDFSAPDRVVIEVGRFVPGKWPVSLPVLHIAFNGRMTRMNFSGSTFSKHLCDAIARYVPFSDDIVLGAEICLDKPSALKIDKKHYQVLCELLWLSGLTVIELLRLQWGHVAFRVDGTALIAVEADGQIFQISIPRQLSADLFSLKKPQDSLCDKVFAFNSRQCHDVLRQAIDRKAFRA